MFYEAVGLMVGADADAARRADCLRRLMAPPNATWAAALAEAAANPDALRQVCGILNEMRLVGGHGRGEGGLGVTGRLPGPAPARPRCARPPRPLRHTPTPTPPQSHVAKSLTNILQTNLAVCSSLGAPFAPQMDHLLSDVLQARRREFGLDQGLEAWEKAPGRARGRALGRVLDPWILDSAEGAF